MKYDFRKTEQTAQKVWEGGKIFEAKIDSPGERFYVLDMFPYPSGDGLHVGHVKGYTASDVISHYKRLKGFSVLHPMGWDAFGLPAENYAIKVKKNPKEVVSANVAKFKSQLNAMGFSYDWSREINTTDPNYYKWTQWIFLQLFNKGLAYEAEAPINFCPSCKTGIANEEVVSGQCERCGTKVVKKNIRQWILKITDYADRLLKDLDGLDWPEPIIEMQRNWIGRSEGSEITFKIVDSNEQIDVYTTRADTLFGCTYVVLAPEHKLVTKLKDQISNFDEVDRYLEKVSNKSDLERAELDKEKTGVKLEGIMAINPINNEEIEVWVADYVLASYGTGAVMAVPAHDDRDFEFAKKYNIAIRYVIDGEGRSDQQAFVDYGKLENSGEFDGQSSDEAKKTITQMLEKDGLGSFTVNYKLRDWVFSRQRYWGEPIPLVHCPKCGTVAVPEADLPVTLPEVENYEPSGTGESPLAKIESWVNTQCPKCGGLAKRETNTMPQWAGSCWYYLRFADPKNEQALISKEADERFLPVDFYIGGAEHAVLHLLYARFWHKVLYDIGAVKDSEPFAKLRSVGLILAPDRQKMSKSRGNVINPDDMTAKYGADALRMYELFIGPFDQPAVWQNNGIVGTSKFLEKVAQSFKENPPSGGHSGDKLNKLSVSVEEKINSMSFNTAIADFMKFGNEVELNTLSADEWKRFLVTLSPFAPHLCETLWQRLGKGSIFKSSWPEAGEVKETEIKFVIQINGKMIEVVNLPLNLDQSEIKAKILSVPKIAAKLDGKTIKKEIFIKNKIINFVV